MDILRLALLEAIKIVKKGGLYVYHIEANVQVKQVKQCIAF